MIDKASYKKQSSQVGPEAINISKWPERILIVVLSLVILLLAIKFKIINQNAIRPFHYIGIGIIVFVDYLLVLYSTTLASFKRKIYVSNVTVYSFFVLVFYIVVVVQALRFSVRSFKDSVLSLSVYIGLLILLQFFRNLFKLETKRFLDCIAKSIVLLATVSLILGYYLYFIGKICFGPIVIEPSPSFIDRMHGILGEPTQFGALLGMGMISICFWLKNNRRKLRYILLFLFFTGILYSGSRNAILSLVLSLLAFHLLSPYFGNKKILVGIISAVLIILTPIFIQNHWVLHKIVVALRVNDPNQFERIYVWMKTLSILCYGSTSELLFGHGYGYLESTFGSSFNVLIRFAIDFGLLFVLFFILYLVVGFILVLEIIKNNDDGYVRHCAGYCVSMLIYWVVFSMFSDMAFSSFFYFAEFGLFAFLAMIPSLKESAINYQPSRPRQHNLNDI
jgi:hypothetical protein